MRYLRIEKKGKEMESKMKKVRAVIPLEVLMSKIYFLREQKVMLDKDLALLYGVKAIRLREQVKRNPLRFPDNFMFQLSQREVEVMVSQNAIPSKKSLGGSLPYAFTEHGILMLANVLKSDRAVKVSIRIIELFVKMREMMLSHAEWKTEMERVKRRLSDQGKNIELLFSYFDEFVHKPKPRRRIGFRVSSKRK